MVVSNENQEGREDGIRWVMVLFSSPQPLPEEDRVNHKLFSGGEIDLELTVYCIDYSVIFKRAVAWDSFLA